MAHSHELAHYTKNQYKHINNTHKFCKQKLYILQLLTSHLLHRCRHPLPASMIIEECEDTILARLRRNQLEDEEIKNIRKQVEEKKTEK